MMGGICNQKFKSTVCHEFTDGEHRWGGKRENGKNDNEVVDGDEGKEDNMGRVNCKGMSDDLGRDGRGRAAGGPVASAGVVEPHGE